MKRIYKIIGGGQQVRQNQQYKMPTEIIEVQESLYPEKSNSSGCDSFTGTMWAEDLKTLKRWSRNWAGARVNFSLHHTSHD